MLTVYTYSKCSTCREATAWLVARGVPFTEKAIRETPPTRAEFNAMLAAHGGNLRRLFNTSGIEYRAQGIGAKLDSATEDQAFALFASNGMLVKRPFLIGPGVALTGFDSDRWAAALPAGDR